MYEFDFVLFIYSRNLIFIVMNGPNLTMDLYLNHVPDFELLSIVVRRLVSTILCEEKKSKNIQWPMKWKKKEIWNTTLHLMELTLVNSVAKMAHTN